jgi:hypothetical protein
VRLCLLFLIVLGVLAPTPATALIEPFDPANLLTDAEFNDSNAMSCAQIQDFLAQRSGVLKDYIDNGKSAAQHVCEQAAAFGVNPKILLTMIQKEQALLTDPTPDERQLGWAAGCGPGQAATRGFGAQMACMGRTMRRNFDRPGTGRAIDGVVPATQGTLALYRYTTHVDGNRLFWRLWQQWFADGGAPAPAAAPAQSAPLEIVVDSRDVLLTPALRANLAPCRLGWASTGSGLGGHHWLTPNVARSASSTNRATWRPNLPFDGRYRVHVFVPDHTSRVPWDCGALSAVYDSTRATYTVGHRDGSSSVTLNQAPLVNQWAALGEFAFRAGTDGSVTLSDVTGEPDNTRWLNIDEIKFEYLGP